ncbi:helix-turn-helix transcriptional regulator [Desulforegula conservatrix]|uniref:helix-turn-helix transcriptional regulator n=1 Tax=Desulforegula conservatrix TaxID=153026 RepID=UPI00041737A9|nr:AlpA family phage regulatory protein [Desulforegula conservatrix]
MEKAPPLLGLLRLKQIVGDKKQGIPPLIPISKTTWWLGVKEGRFPKPIKLTEKCTAWRVEDIQALINNGYKSG